MDAIYTLINKQYTNRAKHKHINRMKINLYKWYEVEALGQAIKILENEFGNLCVPECLMVGDSYLNTHLWMNWTRLSEVELNLFMRVYLDIILEVRIAMDTHLKTYDTYLVADMPDWSYKTEELALYNAQLLLKFWADVIKLEVDSIEKIEIITFLSEQSIPIMWHIWYTPQTSDNKAYGTTFGEAKQILEFASKIKKAWAISLVIERVDEAINESLNIHRHNWIPVYSIFSGKSNFWGQSINVWDSVFKPNFKALFFPPTWKYSLEEFPWIYRTPLIAKHLEELIRLTIKNEYPLSPRSRLSNNDAEQIRNIDPWML